MQPAPEPGRDATYRQVSAQYLDAMTGQDFARWYKHRSSRHLATRAGHHVRDVGCGTGDDMRALTELVGPTGRAGGVGNREDIIEEARRRACRHSGGEGNG